jgi:hypothetical protein
MDALVVMNRAFDAALGGGEWEPDDLRAERVLGAGAGTARIQRSRRTRRTPSLKRARVDHDDDDDDGDSRASRPQRRGSGSVPSMHAAASSSLPRKAAEWADAFSFSAATALLKRMESANGASGEGIEGVGELR